LKTVVLPVATSVTGDVADISRVARFFSTGVKCDPAWPSGEIAGKFHRRFFLTPCAIEVLQSKTALLRSKRDQRRRRKYSSPRDKKQLETGRAIFFMAWQG